MKKLVVLVMAIIGLLAMSSVALATDFEPHPVIYSAVYRNLVEDVPYDPADLNWFTISISSATAEDWISWSDDFAAPWAAFVTECSSADHEYSRVLWGYYYSTDNDTHFYYVEYTVHCIQSASAMVSVMSEQGWQQPEVIDAFTTICQFSEVPTEAVHIDITGGDGRSTMSQHISVIRLPDGNYAIPAILPTGITYEGTVEVWLGSMLLSSFTIEGALLQPQQGEAIFYMNSEISNGAGFCWH